MSGLIIRENERLLLAEHGLLPNASQYVTIVLGTGRQTREDRQMLIPDRGYIKPSGVIDCVQCREKTTASTLLAGFGIGPHTDWYEGKSVREKHWHVDKVDPEKTNGLKIGCFYSVYMTLLHQAQRAYKGSGGLNTSHLEQEGRTALVRVSVNDILSVQAEANDESALKSETIGRGVTLKISKLKVLDLIDQLPLIPSEEFLDFVLAAPAEWHRAWHRIVDAIQPTTWHNFPARMVTSLALVKWRG